MRELMSVLIVGLMMSCKAAPELREIKLERYKELTQNVCIDHPEEIRLAQALYIEMIQNN